MTRWWRPVGLVAAVLCAQLLLAVHGIGHAFGHDHDHEDGTTEVCVECLALAGLQGAAPAHGTVPAVPAAAVLVTVAAASPAPSFALLLVFQSRAPPALPSR